MLSLLTLKILFVAVIFLMAIGAGYAPFRSKIRHGHAHEFAAGQALASGVFLGAGLIHMLGDAASDFANSAVNYPVAFLLAGLTFLFLLFLEHLARQMIEEGQGTQKHFAVLATLILSIHSLLAGAALGLSGSVSILLVLFTAIIAHKWAASFALATQINQSSLSIRTGLILFLVFACMTPLGILLGDIVTSATHSSPWLEPTFNALAAGTFLYLGTLHGLSRSIMVKHCCNLRQFSYVVVGFLIMAIVAIFT